MTLTPEKDTRLFRAANLGMGATVVVSLVGAGILLDRADLRRPEPSRALEALKPAPTNLELPVATTGGELRTFALDEHRGRAVVVHFFASWCPQCLDERPVIDALWNEGKTAPFDLVLVAVTDDLASLRSIGVLGADSPPVLHDADGAASQAWNVQNLPHTFLIDAKGRIALHLEKPLSDATVTQLVRIAQGDGPKESESL